MGILDGGDLVTQRDIQNSGAIFQTVSKLIEKFSVLSVVPVVFDKSVFEINPLFFIVLLAECERKSKKLYIDIRNLNDFNQLAVQHILRQQLDLDKFDLYIQHKYYETDPYSIVKNTIIATKDATPYAISFNPDKEDGYHYLPVMSLRGLPYMADEWDTGALYNKEKGEKKRKAYYSRVAFQEDNLKNLQNYQKSLKTTLEDFFKYLKLDKLDHAEPLGTILFELIDNIRKHTPDNVSGFFSFSRIQRKDENGKKYFEYQLIIADNGEEGVLRNYRKELICEKFRLRKVVKDKNLLEGYDKTIEQLEKKTENDDKAVLYDLYGLTSIKTTHQVPRVAMHFGIPMLLKMLKAFRSDVGKRNLLEVYTHRDDNFYKVAYNHNVKFKNTQTVEHFIKGTYVVLTFTDRLASYQSPLSHADFVGNVKNQDYQQILQNYKIHERQINTFQYIQDISHIPNETSKIILDASRDTTETFSEFLRKVYLKVSKNNLTDIVIANTDIKGVYSHLQLMAHIIYDNIDKPYERTINLLFYDKYSPGVVFLGGKSKNDFLYVADRLKHHYQIDTSLGLGHDDIVYDNDQLLSIESSLFHNEFLLPFELFPIKDNELNETLLFEGMLNNFLNENAKNDFHIDTQVSIHTDNFLDFRAVFEDSRWVKRLAFLLAKKLDGTITKKIFMLGTDRYTNMLLSLTQMYINSYQNTKIEKYKIFNIYQQNDYDAIKQELIDSKGAYEIVLISSVRYKGEKINQLKAELNNSSGFQEFSIIHLQLKSDNTIENDNSIVKITNNAKTYPIKSDEYCSYCKEERQKPLVELDRNDPFLLKDTYFEVEEVRSESFPIPAQINWNKSFHFGHIERGSNHFIYYMDTIEFFKNNYKNIEKFLQEIKSRLNINSEKVLLLAPSHDTHNNFTSLVNRVIFENEATVLYFDKNKGEDNFHKLSSYKFDWEKTKVFFVDDSIASGYTMEYFYTLLRSLPNYSSINENGFDGVFVMIDRISSVDEKVIENYLKSNANLHAFTTYNVKPIKTEVEACFLCQRAEEYLDLMSKSVLDLTIFKMADKALKIRKTSYKEDRLGTDFEDRLKAYIKALATDFISRRVNDVDIEQLLEDFDNFLWVVFNTNNRSFIDDYGENFIKEVLAFESEIALLKAMSFPKISYFYSIRKMVIAYIVNKIKSDYIGKEESIADKTIEHSSKLDGKVEEKSSKHKFIKKYREKTNLHKLNAYFSILGYFRDPILLRSEYISLYFEATKKKDDFNDKEVLHTYPFAVKMTISDNEEKSQFFENNLKKFLRESYQFQDIQYALMDALYLENTLYDRKDFIDKIKIKTKYRDTKKVKDVFIKIKGKTDFKVRHNDLKEILLTLNKNIEEVKLFVYPETYKQFDDYKTYLQTAESRLIDVFADFEEVNNLEISLQKGIKDIFYGTIDDGGVIRRVDDNKIYEKINDTWANNYVDGYTIVRFVKADGKLLFDQANCREKYMQNRNLWFKPIGCMVLKHHREVDHLKIVRKVLAIRYELVEFIIDELGHGGIQEAINSVYKDAVINNVNHSIKKYLNIGAKTGYITSSFDKDDFKEYMKRDGFSDENTYLKSLYSEINQYSFGLINLASIADITEKRVEIQKDITDVLSNEFIEQLKMFFKIASNIGMYRVVKPNLDINIKYEYLEKDSLCLYLDANQFEYFLFEIVFNIVKAAYDLSEEIVNIEIESIEKGIQILNKVAPAEILKLQHSLPYQKYSKSGLGTKKIIEMLKRNNYTIEFKVNNKDLFVSKSGKRYNVSMNIFRGVKNESFDS